MLRPSRPMMRPFMSSAGSWTTRHGGLGRVAGGEPLHDDGEDVAHAAVGVALGLLLDLADEPRGVVADLVLELLEQQLLGLRRRRARTTRSSARTWRSCACGGLLRRCSSTLLARVELGDARARARSSRETRRSSRRPISCRRASASSVSACAAGGSLAVRSRAGAPTVPCRRRASPGARFTSSSAAITRPAARTAAAITISIVRVLSPYAALQGAARSDASMFERRQIESGPEPGARRSA